METFSNKNSSEELTVVPNSTGMCLIEFWTWEGEIHDRKHSVIAWEIRTSYSKETEVTYHSIKPILINDIEEGNNVRFCFLEAGGYQFTNGERFDTLDEAREFAITEFVKEELMK